MGGPKWWADVDPESKDWIAGHLGEVLPYDIADEVSAAGAHLRAVPFLGHGATGYELTGRDAARILCDSRDRADTWRRSA